MEGELLVSWKKKKKKKGNVLWDSILLSPNLYW